MSPATASVTLGQIPPGTATTPPPSLVGVGVPFQSTPGSNANLGVVTINSAEWQTESLWRGQTQGAVYPEHDSFLVLDVTVTGTKGRVHADDFGWSAFGADGTEYRKAASSNFEPKLAFSALTSGQSARGLVALDVQRGPVTVVWSGAYGSDPLAAWSIDG